MTAASTAKAVSEKSPKGVAIKQSSSSEKSAPTTPVTEEKSGNIEFMEPSSEKSAPTKSTAASTMKRSSGTGELQILIYHRVSCELIFITR